jgi:hypothetical protein
MQAALPTPTQADVRWLRGLHELARGWVAAGIPIATAQTDAYVDLIFAFALAQIGATAASEECSRCAIGQLSGRDDAHLLLLQMYGYRIAQARQGEPHSGPLPNEILDSLEQTERLLRYVVDRLRKHSHILEPDQNLNPYRHWGARISDFERALAELTDLTDRNELANRVDKLLREVPKGAKGNEQRARVLRAGLEAAPRIGEDFARKMLDQTVPAYDALPEAKEMAALMDQLGFLEKALFVAGYFQCSESAVILLERAQRLFRRMSEAESWFGCPSLLRGCIQAMTALRLGDELDSFLEESSRLVLRGGAVVDFSFDERAALERFGVLLCLAEGWYGFGWDSKADPVLQKAWTVLTTGELSPREQTTLIQRYADTLRWKQAPLVRQQLEDVFRHLPPTRDTYTTASHFCVSQLDVVESVALAGVEVCLRN